MIIIIMYPILLISDLKSVMTFQGYYKWLVRFNKKALRDLSILYIDNYLLSEILYKLTQDIVYTRVWNDDFNKVQELEHRENLSAWVPRMCSISLSRLAAVQVRKKGRARGKAWKPLMPQITIAQIISITVLIVLW